jgi:hypothetical protein
MREPMQDSDTAHCIKSCLSNKRICLETLHYCLTQKMTHFQGRHIALLGMCADACELAAKMMIADIQFHRQSCVVAFELCLACAEECEKYMEDTAMKRCADSCRKCAEFCRGMMGTTVEITSAAGQDRRPPGISR